MKAINIDWDCSDTGMNPKDLPTEIEIPKGMTDIEEMSEYVTQVTGFAHQGFNLAYDVKKASFAHDKDFTKFTLDVKFTGADGTGVAFEPRKAYKGIEFSVRANYIEWLDEQEIFGAASCEDNDSFLGDFWYDVPKILFDEVKRTAMNDFGFSVDEESLRAAIKDVMEEEMVNVSTNSLYEKYGENISCGSFVPIIFTELNTPPVIYELHDKQDNRLCINNEMCVIVGKDAKNVELLGSMGKFSLTLDEAATAGVAVDKVKELTKATKDKGAERE